jgi:hypothetical protein
VGALINLTNNSYTYECSLSQDVEENVNVTSLICLRQGDLRMETCNTSELADFSTTVDKKIGENKKEPQPFLPESILILGIYAASVFVAIVVVLVVTYFVGKPEPDEFWWEDKLEKRSY